MINRVILMGRIVADPELKTTNTGISVTSFRIAVDRAYVKQGGERQADFFEIVAWRSTAEFICRNFKKGSLIAVDGQLQSRQYQTKDGQTRTAIEVVADQVSFSGVKKGGSEIGHDLVRKQTREEHEEGKRNYEQMTLPDDDDLPPLDDDLPF